MQIKLIRVLGKMPSVINFRHLDKERPIAQNTRSLRPSVQARTAQKYRRRPANQTSPMCSRPQSCKRRLNSANIRKMNLVDVFSCMQTELQQAKRRPNLMKIRLPRRVFLVQQAAN